MGVHNPSVSSNTVQTNPVVTTTEAVAFTSPPISPGVDGAILLIAWQVMITTGASVNTLTFRIKRGVVVGGSVVGSSWVIPVLASAAQFYSGVYFDAPGTVAGQQYSITVQQGAATGNGTINDGCITVVSL